MPNARVGAMPQAPPAHGGHPPPYHHHGGRGRGRGRHQGISMEDLKKQTAMRLAQEQQRRHGAEEEGDDCEDQSDLNSQDVLTPQRTGMCYPDQVPQYYQHPMQPSRGMMYHNNHDGQGQHPLDSYAFGPPKSQLGVASESNQAAASHGYEGQNSHDGALDMMTPTRGGSRPLQPLTPASSVPSLQEQLNTPQPVNARSSHKRDPHHQKPYDGPDSPDPHRYQRASSPSQRRFDSRGASPALLSPPTKHSQSHLHQRNGAGPPPFETSLTTAGASPNIGGTSKQNKLPHGLTVQELKEMTRARLAAGASSDSGSVGGSVVEEEFQRTQQQLARGGLLPQSFTPNRSRLGSAGSTGSRTRDSRPRHPPPSTPYGMRQRTASVESTASAPPAVVHAPHPDRGGGGPFHRTFSQQGLSEHQTPKGGPDRRGCGGFHHGQMLINPSANHIGTPQRGKHMSFAGGKEPRQMEALETASMTSLNSAYGSEYLGSESSAFPAGIMRRGPGPGTEETAAIPFSRSLSFPAEPSFGDSLEPPLPPPEKSAVNPRNPFFDPLVGGGMNRQRAATDPSGFGSGAVNRLRAATMSPPGLSHLMEHEPLNITGTGGVDELFIPTFDSVSPQNQGSHTPGHGLSAKIVEFPSSPSGSRVSSPTNSRMGNNNSGSGGLFCDGSLQDIFQQGSHETALAATSTSGDGFGNVNDNAAENGPLSGVFRSAASFGGDEQSLRAPGRELTLSSTTSSGGAFFSDAERRGEASRVMGTKSWGGATSYDSHAAQAYSLTTSMLGRDLDALLSFSDQQGHGLDDQKHNRAPSLVSKIDPELKTDANFNENASTQVPGLSTLSSNDPILPANGEAESTKGRGGVVGQL